MTSSPSMVILNLPNSKFSKMDYQEVLVIFNLRPKRAQKKQSRSLTTVSNSVSRLRFNATSRKRTEKNKGRNTQTYSSRTFLTISQTLNSRNYSNLSVPSALLPSTRRKTEPVSSASSPTSTLRPLLKVLT